MHKCELYFEWYCVLWFGWTASDPINQIKFRLLAGARYWLQFIWLCCKPSCFILAHTYDRTYRGSTVPYVKILHQRLYVISLMGSMRLTKRELEGQYVLFLEMRELFFAMWMDSQWEIVADSYSKKIWEQNQNSCEIRLICYLFLSMIILLSLFTMVQGGGSQHGASRWPII